MSCKSLEKQTDKLKENKCYYCVCSYNAVMVAGKNLNKTVNFVFNQNSNIMEQC